MRRCLLVCSTFLVLFALFRTPPTLAQATWAPWAAGPTIPVPASPPQLQEIRSTPPPPTPSILSDEERTIIKALNEVHDWSLNDITLTDLAAQLKAWMPCRLDTDALNDVGMSPSVVLGSLHGVKLSTQVVLHHLLANADMSWMVQDGELVLTTPERAEDHLRLLVLPVVDLIETPGLGEEGYDYDSLIELITSLVSPACWDEGGPGISTFGGALVFHQSWAISDQIEHLAETMRRAARNETDLTAIDMPWYGFPFDADLQPPVEQCLTLDLESVTLDELVEKLSQQTTVPIRLDARALNDRNWCKSQRIRFTANNEPLSRSLRRALGAHDLSVGYDYPFLVVTTKEGADYLQSIRVYPIQDFLKDASHPVPTGTVRAATCDEWWRASAEELAALVTSVADRSAWSEAGGAGEIAISRVPPALVVAQSLEVHEKIEDLLRRLRQLPDVDPPSTMAYVAVYPLSPGVPIDRTITLLQQLVPDANNENRAADNHAYLEVFGQGILVCHTQAVHNQIAHALSRLGLLRQSAIGTGSGLGGFSTWDEQSAEERLKTKNDSTGK